MELTSLKNKISKITFDTPKITITTKQDFDSMMIKDPTQLYAINDSATIYIGDTLLYKDDGVITTTAIKNKYDEPKYKLRKCECCGGPLKGITCEWCGAEYEVYY